MRLTRSFLVRHTQNFALVFMLATLAWGVWGSREHSLRAFKIAADCAIAMALLGFIFLIANFEWPEFKWLRPWRRPNIPPSASDGALAKKVPRPSRGSSAAVALKDYDDE